MKSVLGIVFLMVISGSALARGYGMAGCGLGSLVLGDKKGMMQIFASTTNGTFGSQTFGISTGTSNCQDGSGKTASLFIEANKVALSNDIARGQGETLDSLAAIYGVQNVQEMGSALQSEYSMIFPSQNVSADRINATIADILNI